nr:glycosyl hydrolase family 28-related protein [Mycobacterium sp. E3298]
MPLSNNKLLKLSFKHKDQPDKPNMTTEQFKAAVDSQAEELQAKHNSLIDELEGMGISTRSDLDKHGYDITSAKYGAINSGSIDTSQAFIFASFDLTAIGGGEMYVPPGTYRISANVDIPSGVVVVLANGARISVDTGFTFKANIQARPSSNIFTGPGTVLLPYTKEIYPQWFGAKPDGATENSAAINNMLASSDSCDMIFTAGVYLVETDITVLKPDVRLIGRGATIKSLNATAGRLAVKSCKEISGFTFDRATIYVPYDYDNGFMRIQFNKFLNTGLSIYFGCGFSRWAQNVHILWNEFNGCSYAVYGALTNGLIAFNKMSNSLSRNIELAAGDDTVILGNRIDGGITAISFLCSRDLTGGKGAHNVVISENVVSNVSEEAIGCDLRGNTSGKTGTVKTGTITAYYRDTPGRQIVPDFAFTNYQYLRYYVVMLTGKSKGKIYEIDYMGPTGVEMFQLSEGSTSTSQPDVAVGDKFVIQVPYLGFVISNNVIHNCTTGISLWGNSFHTRIVNNRIRNTPNAAVAINTLYGFVDGGYGCCFHNTIEGNEIMKGNIQVTGFDKYGAADLPSYGNQIINNRIQHGTITYSRQNDFLIEGNICDDLIVEYCGNTLPDASQQYAGRTRVIVDSGIKQRERVNVTSGATSSGNITISLGGANYQIAVVTGDTPSTIASKINAATFNGFTTEYIGGATSVKFISTSLGSKPTGSFNAGTTGAAGTFSTIALGSNGSGVADTAYVCLKSATGTYSWKPLTNG